MASWIRVGEAQSTAARNKTYDKLRREADVMVRAEEVKAFQRCAEQSPTGGCTWNESRSYLDPKAVEAARAVFLKALEAKNRADRG